MNTFFDMMRQIGWALTVGGLIAALTAVAQIIGLALCALAGGGCAFWVWRKRRSGRRSP